MPRATVGRSLRHVAIAAVVGIALLILAKIAARFYYDPALWALAILVKWVPLLFLALQRYYIAGILIGGLKE